MNYQDGFLLDIVANPQDDTPRLIYSDWLEEQEQTDHANFIRFQIAREKLTWGLARFVDKMYLMEVNKGLKWRRDILQPMEKVWYTWGGEILGEVYTSWGHYANTAKLGLKWTRGFVSKVSLDCKDFTAKNAQELFSYQPVEEVQLLDKAPHPDENRPARSYAWYGKFPGLTHTDERWVIPVEIFTCLEGGKNDETRMIDGEHSWWEYPSEEEAHQALSKACVKCGRKLVGLP